MTELERAIAEIRAARTPSIIALDALALAEAVTRPILVANGVISWLTGGNPSPTGVANQVGDYYSSAEGNLINATGSPAAKQFIALQNEALQPQFQQQQQALPGELAGAGIYGSGAASNAEGQLAAQQAAVLAGADAPLYQSALAQYGGLLGGGAGAQANAYTQTNSQDLNSFYQAVQAAASAYGAATGVPGSGGGGATNPYAGADVASDSTAPAVAPASLTSIPTTTAGGFNPYVVGSGPVGTYSFAQNPASSGIGQYMNQQNNFSSPGLSSNPYAVTNP